MLYGFHGILSIEKKLNSFGKLISCTTYHPQFHIYWWDTFHENSLHYNHIHSLTFINLHSLYYKKMTMFFGKTVYLQCCLPQDTGTYAHTHNLTISGWSQWWPQLCVCACMCVFPILLCHVMDFFPFEAPYVGLLVIINVNHHPRTPL
jgi:hypothetical protein